MKNNVANIPPTISAPTPVNAGTVDTDGKIKFNENAGTATIFDVNATDTDGGTMTYSVSGTYPAGAFSIDANGTVSVNTTALGNITTDTVYTVTVSANDGQGGTTTRDVDVRVKNNVANIPPTISAPTPVNAGTVDTDGKIKFNENAGTATIFDVNATDTDGGTMTYSVWGTYQAGAFSIDANGTVSVNTTALGNITTDTVYTVTVSANRRRAARRRATSMCG